MKRNDHPSQIKRWKKWFIPQKRTTCFGPYNNHHVLLRKELRQHGVYVTLTAESYNRPPATECDLVLLLSISSILASSNSCLRLLPRLPFTSTFPYIFPTITCFRRQFLRMTRPIHLAFLLFTACTTFLCALILCNTSFLTRSVQMISGKHIRA
jgi:hypothetical protein